MVQCPHCGAGVDERATVCGTCGGALGRGGADERPRNGREQDPHGSPRNGGNRRGRDRRGRHAGPENQPRRNRQRETRDGDRRSQGYQREQERPTQAGGRQRPNRQRGQRRRQGGQPRRDRGGTDSAYGGTGAHTRPDSSGNGVSRRTLLGAGGLVVLAGGGYLGYREFLAADGDPNETAREFLTAAASGDTEEARSLVHEDSPQDFRFGSAGSGETSLSVTDVRELDTGSATDSTADRRVLEVEATVSDSRGTRDLTYRVDVRTEGGDWKVWTVEVTDVSGADVADAPPQASFEFEWVPGSESVGRLILTHDGGETIPAGELRLRGSNPAADNLGGTWADYDPSLDAGDGVSAGRSVAVDDVGGAATIRIVWESATADESATLGEWNGPDA